MSASHAQPSPGSRYDDAAAGRSERRRTRYLVMLGARIVLGLAVGAAAATVPLFLAEMAPAHRRGRMVTINELMIVGGQFLAFAINALINALFAGAHVWRWMLIVAVVPAIALF